MTKTIFKLFTITIISLILISCQPTPTEEVVTNKANNNIVDTIKSSEESDNETILENEGDDNSDEAGNNIYWDESHKFDNIELTINSDMIVTDNCSFTLKKGERIKDLDGENMKILIDYLFTEEPYSIDEGIGVLSTPTKAEIEKLIVKLEKEKLTVKDDEPIINDYESMIEENKKLYQSAPPQYRVSTASYEWKDQYNTEAISIFSMNDSKDTLHSCACLFNTSSQYMFSYQRDKTLKYRFGSALTQNIPDLQMSLNDAKEIVDEFLAYINENFETNYSVYQVNAGLNIPLSPSAMRKQNKSGNYETTSYIFSISKLYSGLPALYVESTFGADHLDEYTFPWGAEKFEVAVDNEGIASIMWMDPTIESDVIGENVRILPNSDIQSKFIDYIKLQWSYNSTQELEKTEININRIVLNMMRFSQKDNQKEYIMVPVWDFFGTVTEHYPTDVQSGDDNSITYDLPQTALLTINAIDGSIIDRRISY